MGKALVLLQEELQPHKQFYHMVYEQPNCLRESCLTHVTK